MTHPGIWIIGVLDDGVERMCGAALQRIKAAGLVIGHPRFLTLLDAHIAPDARRRSLAGAISQVPQWLEEARNQGVQAVVLATGDPLFFGLAGTLTQTLPPGSFQVLSQITTPQRAFEGLALPWQEAFWLSVHARESGEWGALADFDHALYPFYMALEKERLLAILTSPANDPNRLARMVLSLGQGEQWTFGVCQRLGWEDESLALNLSPWEVADGEFSQPNVVILQRKRSDLLDSPLPFFGLKDEFFLPHAPGKGLITRQEVRAVSLAYLAMRRGDVVWDIGAGSGSVGLEAARLNPDGQVWAMEKNLEAVETIRSTRIRLGQYNYRIHHGLAPEGLQDWPDPHGVFIGGSGGELEGLIRLVMQRLHRGGRLVMNFVTLENQYRAVTTLKGMGVAWSMTQINVALSQPLLDMHRLRAESPIWIIRVNKEESAA